MTTPFPTAFPTSFQPGDADDFSRIFGPYLAERAQPSVEPAPEPALSAETVWTWPPPAPATATQIVRRPEVQRSDPPAVEQPVVGWTTQVVATGVSVSTLAWLLAGVVLSIHIEALVLFLVLRH